MKLILNIALFAGLAWIGLHLVESVKSANAAIAAPPLSSQVVLR